MIINFQQKGPLFVFREASLTLSDFTVFPRRYVLLEKNARISIRSDEELTLDLQSLYETLCFTSASAASRFL